MRRNRSLTIYPGFIERIFEPYDDGWTNYEEPFINAQTLRAVWKGKVFPSPYLCAKKITQSVIQGTRFQPPFKWSKTKEICCYWKGHERPKPILFQYWCSHVKMKIFFPWSAWLLLYFLPIAQRSRADLAVKCWLFEKCLSISMCSRILITHLSCSIDGVMQGYSFKYFISLSFKIPIAGLIIL